MLEKYQTRLKYLQNRFKYRPDECAIHHFKIFINCDKNMTCNKKEEMMTDTAHFCALNHRFQIVNLSIASDLPGRDGHHANSVIIDHQRKEYERFEPIRALPPPREDIVNDVLSK